MRLISLSLAFIACIAGPVGAEDATALAARLVAAGAPDLAMQQARAALQASPGDAAWQDAYWLAASMSDAAPDLHVPPPSKQADAASWAGYRLALAEQAADKADWPDARAQWAQVLWQGGLGLPRSEEVRARIAQSWLQAEQIAKQPEVINPILLRLVRDDPKQQALVDTAALRLIDAGQAKRSLDLLDALSPHSPLRLLAKTRLAGMLPEQAEVKLREQAQGAAALPAWQGLLRLAQERADSKLQVEALEYLLTLEAGHSQHAFSLWSAYANLAEQVANRRQLLVGMDAAWLEQAKGLLGESPLEGRALLAWLARQGKETKLRIQAMEILADSLNQARAGLAPRLLGNAPLALPRLPESLRYRLGEQAHAAGDLVLAAGWWDGVSAAAAGLATRSWYLKQADINGQAGRKQRAMQWLRHALKAGEPLTGAETATALAQLTQQVQLAEVDLVEQLARQLMDIAPPSERRRVWQLLGDVAEQRGQWAEAAARQLLAAGEATDNLALVVRVRASRNLQRAGLLADAARQSRLFESVGSPVNGDAKPR